MDDLNHVVVVGASLAGLRSVESLRRLGFSGQITLVGAEHHFPPYDRPPLSKEILRGEWGLERGRLRVVDGLDVLLRLGVRAENLDLPKQHVELDDGSSLGFDALVVATGASPRRLPFTGKFSEGIHELRTYDDCVSLRTALERNPRVVIIGAGFIGCEVAAVCREQGIDVTVVEALDWPMDRVLGGVIGEWAARVHRGHGVDLRLGTGVTGIEGTTGPEMVLLQDGSELAADIVVVAVGVAPETEWLERSALMLRDGLVLDEFCRAPGFHEVVGAGDVARWYNPMFEREMRVEHWTNAVEQSSAAAAALLSGDGELKPFSTVPYVWSDQYGMKLQYVGVNGTFHKVTEGAFDDDKFVAVFETEGRLVGALCVNSPGRMVRYKRLIAAHTRVGDLDSMDF